MRPHHATVQGVKHCLHHDERFTNDCPECMGEDVAKLASTHCETHDETFESVCPHCAMWKANILDQDAEPITKEPAAFGVRADWLGGECPINMHLKVEIPRPPEAPTLPPKPESALQVQEGGDHYKKLKIQPVEYIHANGLQFAEGSVIKYVTRWRDKNGIADLKKARHFLDLIIELESAKCT